MFYTFVDSTLEELSRLNNHRSLAVSLKPQIEAFEVDLRFLKMFLCCLITWDKNVVTDLDFDSKYMLSSIECIWDKSGEGLYAAGHKASDKRKFKDWKRVSSKLEEKMQLCKQEINKYCSHLISSCFSLQCQSFPSNQILEFLDEILNNLKHLDVPAENQIETMKEKLLILRNLVDFAAGTGRCSNGKDLSGFLIHVHTWANQAACLTCLYWVEDVEDDEEIGKRLNLYLTALLQKVNPCTPEFTGMCFAVMKSIKYSRADDAFIFGRFLSNFVDFLLQNLAIALEDQFEILYEGLLFLVSFLVDPPLNSADDFRLTDEVLDEASRLICFVSETREDSERDRTVLLHLIRKIHDFRGQIEMRYVQIPNFSFPKTNGLGFVEHLLGNIEYLTRSMNCNPKIVPFAKHQIFRVKEELLSLRQAVHVDWELLNEHNTQIIHVAYKAELAVNSSFTIDHPIWYHLGCLSRVLGEIKDIQNEVDKFKSNQIYATAYVAPKLPSVYTPPVSGLDEIVVGFIDEGEVLIDRITRGTAQLDIVPIVGMGGLGKTTLARKLYNTLSIRFHFHVRAFCNVGQEYSSRNIFLEILKDLTVINSEILSKEELAHQVYKCLKGHRYLIIMDDIWDVAAWEGVKRSFPDDKNGSRIVFTTRISNVALQAKSDSSPHYLRFFTDEESWELLQAKIFHNDLCPTELCEVGMSISRKCSGLPLAVVLIAGLLARIPTSLFSWSRIADDLISYVSAEGCLGILELSYKHLPLALKSCLLYFGAFVKDKTIIAKRLMLMWAAEGFVPKRNSSFLSVAKQYLDDLVDRSLVIIHSRSSTGGIKLCSVHDLIRDMCQAKSLDEQFFRIIRISNDSNSVAGSVSMPVIYAEYRLCIHADRESFVNGKASGPTARTILYFPISDRTVYSEEPFPYSNFKLLQLLDLHDVKFDKEDFPEEVTTLVNLKYLALANERFTFVQPVIANLWNLETFVLKRHQFRKIVLPDTLWTMKMLKHVDVGKNVYVDMDGDVGMDSSKLPNVESFSSVTIAHGEDGEEVLRRLSNARKLTCCFLSSWNQQLKCDQLPELEHLTMLESLNIVSSDVSYPCVFSFPATLKKLSLSKFFLPWSEFSIIIANLPCLEVLKLMSNAFEGQKWAMEAVREFPKLKYLELHELDVVDWIVSGDPFPFLERLILSYCHYLVEIPSYFGGVPTMTAIELYISNHGAEESATRIQIEQLDYGNKSLEVRVSETHGIME